MMNFINVLPNEASQYPFRKLAMLAFVIKSIAAGSSWMTKLYLRELL